MRARLARSFLISSSPTGCLRQQTSARALDAQIEGGIEFEIRIGRESEASHDLSLFVRRHFAVAPSACSDQTQSLVVGSLLSAKETLGKSHPGAQVGQPNSRPLASAPDEGKKLTSSKRILCVESERITTTLLRHAVNVTDDMQRHGLEITIASLEIS